MSFLGIFTPSHTSCSLNDHTSAFQFRPSYLLTFVSLLTFICCMYVHLLFSLITGGQWNVLVIALLLHNLRHISDKCQICKKLFFPPLSPVSDLYSYFQGPPSLCDLLYTPLEKLYLAIKCLLYLSSECLCDVSPAIWASYPWLLCRSYARAGWPSATLASWKVEPRNTGLFSLPRACPGSKMMRWGIHTHNHA